MYNVYIVHIIYKHIILKLYILVNMVYTRGVGTRVLRLGYPSKSGTGLKTPIFKATQCSMYIIFFG